MKRVLITGGSGFIGSHVIEHLLRMTNWDVITMDRLGVSGNYHRIRDMKCWEEEGYRVSLVHHDLRSPVNEMLEKKIGRDDQGRDEYVRVTRAALCRNGRLSARFE